MKTCEPILKRSHLLKLSKRCLSCRSLRGAGKILRGVARTLPETSWRKEMERLAFCLGRGKSRYRLFVKGNTKLPFYGFSVLPLLTCPGKGACKQFCYSLTAWKTPGGYLRQLQNTLILRHRPLLIEKVWRKLPEGIVRLYVDGDFATADEVAFWFRLCKCRPDLKVFGYSKSFDEIWEGGQKEGFPPNYLLNLSSGVNIRKITYTQMETLPIVRGYFHSLEANYHTGRRAGFERFGDRAYHASVREAAKEAGLPKVLSCPGRCGSCCRGLVACASEEFRGIPIAIAIHR